MEMLGVYNYVISELALAASLWLNCLHMESTCIPNIKDLNWLNIIILNQTLGVKELQATHLKGGYES
jgi:hypothetical protein